MTYEFNGFNVIDCQGLAGAQTLAACREGFMLAHRASLGKFGDHLTAANRGLLPGAWEQDGGNAWDEWEPASGAYLIGTPPCSGFSVLNTTGGSANKRGPESAINDCMRQLVMYASRCRGADGGVGPEVVAFESVQGAFKDGRDLMVAFRDLLSEMSGQRYTITHVMTAGATVGAAQMRHRYYFVAHRIPFGIHRPERRRVATYQDAIGDLVGLPTDWWGEHFLEDGREGHDGWWLDEFDARRYVDSPTGGGRGLYAVGDHVIADDNKDTRAFRELAGWWNPGERLQDAMKAYYLAHGRTPVGVENWWNATEMRLRHAFSQPKRIRPDQQGLVLTGDCMREHLHWSEPRNFTARECARLMGYPDAWRFDSCTSAMAAGKFIGKCAPVQTGRWLARQVYRSLCGMPGDDQKAIGPDEFLHDSTGLYRAWRDRAVR